MPNSFVDATGREWVLTINCGTLERVKEMTDIDLGYIKYAEFKIINLLQQMQGDAEVDVFKMFEVIDELNETKLGRLSVDPLMQSKVLFALVSEQAKERVVTREQFYDLLDGETLNKAIDTFWEAYSDFFQQNGQKNFSQMAKGCRQINAIVRKATEPFGEALQNIELEARPPEPESVTVTPGSSSTEQPESLVSTLDHSP